MKITRAESLKIIGEKVENVEFAKIAKHIYSDYILEMLAKSDRELIDRIAHTKLSNEAVERLLKAYDTNIITMGDLMHIANYSLVTGGNERYLNDYFSSIAAGLDTKTASQILVASKFEDWSYNEIYNLIKSGTYQVSERTFVQLNTDVAREIDKLGMELYAYDKSNDFYLVKDIEKAITDGDAITFSKSALAAKINEMRNAPDWNAFRDYIAEDMENIEQLTADGLIEAYEEYCTEELNIELGRKVDRNYEDFIYDIREKGVDEAIKCSYEIAVKTNIQSFIESEPADISRERYRALISADNPLDEIYEAWLKREYLKTYDDIPEAMRYAADGILESKKRAQEKDKENLSDKPQVPKKKGGAR
ncbi:MAG: DUF3848 domain-containing protein [Ruminococcus sp.]|nr:DUF3848 domain-containing protein [Ruminococcus sp.]